MVFGFDDAVRSAAFAWDVAVQCELVDLVEMEQIYVPYRSTSSPRSFSMIANEVEMFELEVGYALGAGVVCGRFEVLEVRKRRAGSALIRKILAIF